MSQIGSMAVRWFSKAIWLVEESGKVNDWSTQHRSSPQGSRIIKDWIKVSICIPIPISLSISLSIIRMCMYTYIYCNYIYIYCYIMYVYIYIYII